MMRMGSKPALQINIRPPGLYFTYVKEYETGSMSDIDKREVPGRFVGSITVPVTQLAVRSAQERNMDLGAFFHGIAKGDPSLARFFDEPKHLVSLDYADFDGLSSDVEEIPQSLYDEVDENFWKVIGSSDFKVIE
jgi:hypothetical protein